MPPPGMMHPYGMPPRPGFMPPGMMPPYGMPPMGYAMPPPGMPPPGYRRALVLGSAAAHWLAGCWLLRIRSALAACCAAVPAAPVACFVLWMLPMHQPDLIPCLPPPSLNLQAWHAARGCPWRWPALPRSRRPIPARRRRSLPRRSRRRRLSPRGGLRIGCGRACCGRLGVGR